jgi:hypothetical protein
VQRRSYIIKQTCEIVKRDAKEHDPVVDFKAVFTHEWPYGITRRQSGKVDFYWNYSRIGSTRSTAANIQDRFVSVQLNFEGFYLE